MRLSKECIKEIEKAFPHIDHEGIDYIDRRHSVELALTTPQIYESAGLVKKEDAFAFSTDKVDSYGGSCSEQITLPNPQQVIPLDEALAFAEWVDDSIYVLNSDNNLWQIAFNQFDDEEYYTTAQLFNKFKQETNGK